MPEKSTNSTSSQPNLTLKNGVYLTLIGGVSTIALVGYVVVACIIMKHKKSHFANSFYTLALSMAVCDITMLFFDLIYFIPAAILGEANLPHWYTLFIAFVYAWAIFSSMCHMVAISINRLTAVTLLQTYQAYFTVSKLAMIIGACYVFSFMTVIMCHTCGCILAVPNGYTWEWECVDERAVIPMTWVPIFCVLVSVSTASAYLMIIIKMRKSYRTTEDEEYRQQIRKEKSLVIQFGLIVFVFAAYAGIYWVEFFVDNEFARGDGKAIIGFFALLHSGLDPFLYMTFGSEVKRVMFKSYVAPTTGGTRPTSMKAARTGDAQ